MRRQVKMTNETTLDRFMGQSLCSALCSPAVSLWLIHGNKSDGWNNARRSKEGNFMGIEAQSTTLWRLGHVVFIGQSMNGLQWALWWPAVGLFVTNAICISFVSSARGTNKMGNFALCETDAKACYRKWQQSNSSGVMKGKRVNNCRAKRVTNSRQVRLESNQY